MRSKCPPISMHTCFPLCTPFCQLMRHWGIVAMLCHAFSRRCRSSFCWYVRLTGCPKNDFISRKARLKFLVEIMKKSRKNVYPHIFRGGGQGELPQCVMIGTATVNTYTRLELSEPCNFFRKFAKNRGSVWGPLAKNPPTDHMIIFITVWSTVDALNSWKKPEG